MIFPGSVGCPAQQQGVDHVSTSPSHHFMAINPGDLPEPGPWPPTGAAIWWQIPLHKDEKREMTTNYFFDNSRQEMCRNH